MSNNNLKLFLMDYDSLQRFFRQFALIKILAQENEVVENQDSFLVRNFSRTPTSLGMKNHLFGSAGFNNKIKGEMRVFNERFGQFLVRTAKKDPLNVPEQMWHWLDKHVQHCRKFFITYSQFAADLNQINMTMQRALGFGICAGSVAQASAELAMILSGVGLPAGSLVKAVPVTIGEIGKRAALGFGIGYGIGVIEEWGKANKADMVGMSFKEGDAYGATGTWVGFGGEYLSEIGLKRNAEVTTQIYDELKRQRMPALSAADKAKLRNQQQAATAGLKTQGKMMQSGLKALTFANYLLAVKGTYDSLDKCVKHCSFEL